MLSWVRRYYVWILRSFGAIPKDQNTKFGSRRQNLRPNLGFGTNVVRKDQIPKKYNPPRQLLILVCHAPKDFRWVRWPNGWVSGPSLGHLTQGIKTYSLFTVPGGVILCHFYYTKLPFSSEKVFRRSVNYFFSYQVSKKPILITYPNFDFVAHLSNFVCQVGQNPKIEVSYQVTKSENEEKILSQQKRFYCLIFICNIRKVHIL
jgi:hypothetical protein